ncbi:MAG: phage/plasmid primase, P4 family [Candidatus Bathyarchaeota archaeon]|nr:phage/plasmid primase, P4 family [Candidatus Bathyarchaeota archaeon]
MNFNEEDVRHFYQWLEHRPTEYTEIRVIGWRSDNAIIQQWVQNEDDFVKLCRKWSGKRQCYVGINPRSREGGSAEDVSRVVAIPFDVDSGHPSKEAATDEEVEQAKQRMIDLVSWMRVQGYEQPLIAMSGNGFHVIQRVNLDVDDALPSKLEAYFHEAPTEGMDSIFDLPRIIKIPGTMSVKGIPTTERPHRLSYILSGGNISPDNQLAEHIAKLEPYIPPMAPPMAVTATTQKKKIKRRTSSLKPCFKIFAEEGTQLSSIDSEDRLLRLALVMEAHSKGYNQSEIYELFTKSKDYDPAETRKQVDNQLGQIAVKGIKVWSCLAIYKHGGCLGETCSRFKRHVAKYQPTPPPDPGQPVFPDSFFDGNDNFIPTYLVDYILKTTGEGHLLTPTTDKGGDITWRYRSHLGIFRSDGVSYIEKEAKHLLSDKTKRHMLAEVVKLMQVETYIDRDKFEEDPDVLVLINGVYHFDTEELTEHSPQYHAKSRLPITYDPNAECPVILKFLSDVIPADVITFQEWVGYHLIKEYRWAKILLLIGDGENGKSKLLLLLVAFLGNSNTASVELIELVTNRFKKAELYGKLANIAPDLGAEELKYTGRLKSLTGDDYIEAAKKHQHPFRFRNYAKLSFSTNKLPRSPDRSRAWFRRPLIMKCPNIFVGENCDPDILRKITTPQELSGMLNWALEGRRRLIEQGDFTRNETAEQIQELYEELEDDTTAFFNHCVDTNETEGLVPKNDFHKLYYQFCKMKGFAPILKQTFSKKIISSVANLGEGYRKIGDKRRHCWTGIMMKPDKERVGCAKCAGFISCISTVRKYNIYKGKVMEPTLLAQPALENEKKPEKGLSQLSATTEGSSAVHERSSLKKRTSSIAQKLVSAVKTQGPVTLEWLILFLKKYQISHDEAVNIIEGMKELNKLVQRSDNSWEVPS